MDATKNTVKIDAETRTPMRQRFTRLSSAIGRQTSFAAFRCLLAITAISTIVAGCGGEATTVATTEKAADATKTAATSELEPKEIVSQFLDRVRRGGEDASSSELMTKLAQQEMLRIGRPFEFPGSPDTTFEVRETFPIPEQQYAVWVHTYLVEPGESGDDIQYEVVWTLRKETAGWRISGFVVDQGEDMEPLQFDFENGDEMKARLAAIEGEEQAVSR